MAQRISSPSDATSVGGRTGGPTAAGYGSARREGDYIVYLDAFGNETGRTYRPLYYNTNYPNYDTTRGGAAATYGPLPNTRAGDDPGITSNEVMTGTTRPSSTAAGPASTGPGGGGGGNMGPGGSGTGPGSTAANDPATDYSGAEGGFSGMIPAAGLADAWNNPEALIRLFANQYRGMDPAGGGEARLQELSPSLGILWMLAMDQAGRGDIDAEQGSLAGSRDYVNWVEPFMNDIMRAGGGGNASLFNNPGSVLQTILNPQGEALQSYLGSPEGEGSANLTRGDQVDNVLNALRYSLEPSTPTPVLNALLNLASVRGRDYMARGIAGETEGGFLGDLIASLGR